MQTLTKNIQLSEKIEFLNQFGQFYTVNGYNSYIPHDKYRNLFGSNAFASSERMLYLVNQIIKVNGLYQYLQQFVLTPIKFKETLYLLTNKNPENGKENNPRSAGANVSKNY